jgi:hypothetical protein
MRVAGATRGEIRDGDQGARLAAIKKGCKPFDSGRLGANLFALAVDGLR